MPIKLNVSIARKVGLPNFGSEAAWCGLAVDLHENLTLDQREDFQRQALQAYAACRQAVDHGIGRESAQGRAHRNGRNSNGHARSGTAPSTPATIAMRGSAAVALREDGLWNGHAASAKQLAYIRRLAARIEGLGAGRVDKLARRLCGKPVTELASYDASRIIDTLKATKAGQIDLGIVLGAESP